MPPEKSGAEFATCGLRLESERKMPEVVLFVVKNGRVVYQRSPVHLKPVKQIPPEKYQPEYRHASCPSRTTTCANPVARKDGRNIPGMDSFSPEYPATKVKKSLRKSSHLRRKSAWKRSQK
jgi:hypothetical protein